MMRPDQEASFCPERSHVNLNSTNNNVRFFDSIQAIWIRRTATIRQPPESYP